MYNYVLLLIPILFNLKPILLLIEGISLNKNNSYLFNLLRIMTGERILNIIVIIVITSFIIKRLKSNKTMKDFIINSIFISYITILYLLVSYIYIEQFFVIPVSKPFIPETSLNLIPFANISTLLDSKSAFIQVIGNLFLLSPLSFFICYNDWHKTFKSTFYKMFLLVLFIESFQLLQSIINSMYYMTGRKSFDIDDIILNSLSIIIGLVAYNVLKKVILFIKSVKIVKKTDS